ncbi:mRNA-decapping enzyme subunit 2 [Steccherinum ochraceum]|uniref:mRNA-decapping enzyme subunit 2 n=1 Tax=Steccherinum ochraceum TaxID=92696 RepID=A0A4R0RU77_9APHY|nr:mRNA-decapping enzyme subunit 2 [Steccherinum ochraceum]
MASSSSSSPEITAPHSNHNHNHRTRPDQTAHQQRLQECLQDLSSRFILNLPEVELASLERVCFQVEQASVHWYYEDFIREEDPSLPTMTLKKFSSSLFAVCPLLKHFGHDHDQAFQSFLAYKTRVPVCGAIMLNETWDKCLLVKGWKATAAWSFPKGKINEQEPKFRCAIREVLEETGYDLESRINTNDVVNISINEQSVSLFIVTNIPENFPFATRTRKEISKISWFRLDDLPTYKKNKVVAGKFYLIAPFMGPLRAYIRRNKGRRHPRRITEPQPQEQPASDTESPVDTVDLPTPSPQYSEAIVNKPDDTPPDANGLREHPLSPKSHLDFLLHGLSKSAAPEPVELSHAIASMNLNIDAPVSTPSVPSVQSNEPPPVQPSPLFSPPTSSHTVRPSPTPSRNSGVQQTVPPRASARSPLPQASAPPTPASPVSPRSAKRASGLSADISPYFTRAAPAAIPKQMKYLTMLESVAKESERMTPKLERQMQMMDGLLPSYPAPNGHAAPPFFPPPGGSGFGDVPPSHGPTSVPAGLPPGFIPHSVQQDPFTVRPRTSNTFHPVPYQPHFPRASMNEEQLRLIMAGVSPRPPPAHTVGPLGGYSPMQHRQGFPIGNSGPPPHGFQPPPPHLAQPPLRVIPPHQLRNAPLGELGPLSAPPISPTYNLPPRPNPANNALLSILNTPGVPRAVPSVPRATMGGHA